MSAITAPAPKQHGRNDNSSSSMASSPSSQTSASLHHQQNDLQSAYHQHKKTTATADIRLPSPSKRRFGTRTSRRAAAAAAAASTAVAIVTPTKPATISAATSNTPSTASSRRSAGGGLDFLSPPLPPSLASASHTICSEAHVSAHGELVSCNSCDKPSPTLEYMTQVAVSDSVKKSSSPRKFTGGSGGKARIVSTFRDSIRRKGPVGSKNSKKLGNRTTSNNTGVDLVDGVEAISLTTTTTTSSSAIYNQDVAGNDCPSCEQSNNNGSSRDIRCDIYRTTNTAPSLSSSASSVTDSPSYGFGGGASSSCVDLSHSSNPPAGVGAGDTATPQDLQDDCSYQHQHLYHQYSYIHHSQKSSRRSSISSMQLPPPCQEQPQAPPQPYSGTPPLSWRSGGIRDSSILQQQPQLLYSTSPHHYNIKQQLGIVQKSAAEEQRTGWTHGMSAATLVHESSCCSRSDALSAPPSDQKMPPHQPMTTMHNLYSSITKGFPCSSTTSAGYDTMLLPPGKCHDGCETSALSCAALPTTAANTTSNANITMGSQRVDGTGHYYYYYHHHHHHHHHPQQQQPHGAMAAYSSSSLPRNMMYEASSGGATISSSSHPLHGSTFVVDETTAHVVVPPPPSRRVPKDMNGGTGGESTARRLPMSRSCESDTTMTDEVSGVYDDNRGHNGDASDPCYNRPETSNTIVVPEMETIPYEELSKALPFHDCLDEYDIVEFYSDKEIVPVKTKESEYESELRFYRLFDYRDCITYHDHIPHPIIIEKYKELLAETFDIEERPLQVPGYSVVNRFETCVFDIFDQLHVDVMTAVIVIVLLDRIRKRHSHEYIRVPYIYSVKVVLALLNIIGDMLSYEEQRFSMRRLVLTRQFLFGRPELARVKQQVLKFLDYRIWVQSHEVENIMLRLGLDRDDIKQEAIDEFHKRKGIRCHVMTKIQQGITIMY
ncbi:hypothetical protein H4219_005433 [Mycoemilia scoparia]|uniref:Uncharacterized protein n=1 Tax=Mycoemilia scoparia TaxID=417184 RepID=A0A9W8DPB5_9FUNG|nr:hypothetical protein H4219_005433 [Mycoemilia scoparia]